MSKQREVIENKPILTVFAGPNGSGKTTLVEDFSREADLGIVVNADAIGVRLAQRAGQLQANSEGSLGCKSTSNPWDLMHLAILPAATFDAFVIYGLNRPDQTRPGAVH